MNWNLGGTAGLRGSIRKHPTEVLSGEMPWIDNVLSPEWLQTSAAHGGLESQTDLSKAFLTRAFSLQATSLPRRPRPFKSSSVEDDLRTMCAQGRVEEAVWALGKVEQKSTRVSVDLYARVIQSCTDRKAVMEGKLVQAQIIQSGLGWNKFLGNCLVRMFAKCGSLSDAREVFDQLWKQDAFAYTAMISGYAHHGEGQLAVELFFQMLKAGVKPNNFTFVSVLKACARLGALELGKLIHSHVIQSGFEWDAFVRNALVHMYVKCGSMDDARQVFDGSGQLDATSWNIMIQGYVRHDCQEEALRLYGRMLQSGLKPNRVAVVSILKACTSLAYLDQGKQIHSLLLNTGDESDVFVGSILVDMYAKCGSLDDAVRVFNNISRPNVVSWNALVAGYVRQSYYKEALQLFEQMRQGDDVNANSATFVSVIKACANLGALKLGKMVHRYIVARKIVVDAYLGTALLRMYSKCGSIVDARRVFDKLQVKTVVTWNAMIAGYAEYKQSREVLVLFGEMQHRGTKPDSATCVSVLKACSTLAVLEQGKVVHAEVVRWGLGSGLSVGNALMDMYAKCGSMEDASRVFNSLRVRDLISWNILIAGYSLNGQSEKALGLFASMQKEGLTPNKVTFLGFLKACANVAALEHGKEMHAAIRKNGLEMDVVVGSTLVDMYAKCGSIENACQVFDNMEVRTVVSWNAMLSGYAQHGEGAMALKCFKRMRQQGVVPDGVTFLCLLSACSHEGLVKEGFHHFRAMSMDYGITPTVQHFTCIVDLLGHAGLLDEAEKFIKEMAMQPDAVLWRSLLSACRSHGDVSIGVRAFERVVELEPRDVAAHVMLGNLYAASNRWKDVASVVMKMDEAGLRKEPGRSWIEVNKTVHGFVVGDASHPLNRKILQEMEKLKDLLKEAGYIPHVSLVLHPMGDDEKEAALWRHSEKLAICFGMISTEKGSPLTLRKNLRVCADCHNACKLISKVTGRLIQVRDVNRIHKFCEGSCSCKDRW